MEEKIYFVLEPDEEDKQINKYKGEVAHNFTNKKGEVSPFYRPQAKKILIMKKIGIHEKEVGHIFTPSSSSESITNAIQVCGFSEAFDLWGCGKYESYKDIQLLFDNDRLGGEGLEHNRDVKISTGEYANACCERCFRDPCKCENHSKDENPFNVKRQYQLKGRIKGKQLD